MLLERAGNGAKRNIALEAAVRSAVAAAPNVKPPLGIHRDYFVERKMYFGFVSIRVNMVHPSDLFFTP